MNDCDVWVMNYDVEEEGMGRRVGRQQAGIIGQGPSGRGRRVVVVGLPAVFRLRALLRRLAVGLDGVVDVVGT